MLDYRIRTFLTLYRLMNYRKTAEALSMTQPGVTQHIHFLEKAYHTTLFTYDGKTLHRTPSADLLEKSMERILGEERALEQAFAEPGAYLLRIGATKTIGEYVILPMAERFLEQPDNGLELTVANTSVLLEQLSQGKLDFALVEGSFDKSRFGSHLMRREEFVGICGAGHPFAGKAMTPEEMFAQTLIVREEGSGTRGILEQLLRDSGYNLQNFSRVITVSNFTAIRHFVAKGIGITFAFHPVAQGEKALATFSLRDHTVTREFSYVYLSEHTAREKILRFEGETDFL